MKIASKINLVFIILSSFLISKEKFIFLFESDQNPFTGSKIECTIKDENNQDLWSGDIKQKGTYSHEGVEYNKFLIEYNFQNYFDQAKGYQYLTIQFSGQHSPSNSSETIYVSNNQVIHERFWYGDKITDEYAILSPSSTYFKRSECLKDKYNTNPKGYIIKLGLIPSRLKFKSEIRDSNDGRLINKDTYKLLTDKQFSSYLEMTDVIQRNSEYECVIRVTPGQFDAFKARDFTDYHIYFLAENYEPFFVEIDKNKLINNEIQEEFVALKKTYPYELVEQECSAGRFWNDDCGRCICEKGKIHNQKLNECVAECEPGYVGYVENNEWICDLESIQDYEQEELEKAEKNEKVNSCISEKRKIIVENLDKKKKEDEKEKFEYDKILDMVFGLAGAAPTTPIYEITEYEMDQIKKECNDKFNNQPSYGQDKKNDIRNIFDKKYRSCDLIDDLNPFICPNQENKNYRSDVLYLIDLSDALYFKIRNNLDFAFPYILENNFIDNDYKIHPDIIQMQILYFSIDNLIDFDSVNIESINDGSYRFSQSEYSTLANHYLQRLEFLDWYINILFTLDKYAGLKNKIADIYEIDYFTLDDCWEGLDCDINPCQSNVTLTYDEPKSSRDIIENLYSNIKMYYEPRFDLFVEYSNDDLSIKKTDYKRIIKKLVKIKNEIQ